MEQIVKLTGRITEVMPVVTGVSDRTGNAWKSQEYLFEYFAWSGAQYSNKIVCRVFGEEDIAKFNLKQNEDVTITLKFLANKSKDGSRWFNEVRIQQVERPLQTQQPATQQPAAAPQQAAQPANAQQPNNNPPGFERPATSPENGANAPAGEKGGDDDDLPF